MMGTLVYSLVLHVHSTVYLLCNFYVPTHTSMLLTVFAKNALNVHCVIFGMMIEMQYNIHRRAYTAKRYTLE